MPAVAAPRLAEARAEYNATYRSAVSRRGCAGVDRRAPHQVKDGVYATTEDNKPLPEDAEYTLLAAETQIGWLKFAGAGEAPERHMGLLYDGFEMPTRESLGDLDPAAWELGLDNAPSDPWQHQINIVLQSTSTQECSRSRRVPRRVGERWGTCSATTRGCRARGRRSCRSCVSARADTSIETLASAGSTLRSSSL